MKKFLFFLFLLFAILNNAKAQRNIINITYTSIAGSKLKAGEKKANVAKLLFTAPKDSYCQVTALTFFEYGNADIDWIYVVSADGTILDSSTFEQHDINGDAVAILVPDVAQQDTISLFIYISMKSISGQGDYFDLFFDGATSTYNYFSGIPVKLLTDTIYGKAGLKKEISKSDIFKITNCTGGINVASDINTYLQIFSLTGQQIASLRVTAEKLEYFPLKAGIYLIRSEALTEEVNMKIIVF